MKKISKTLLILSASTIGLLLNSCGGGEENNASSTTATAEKIEVASTIYTQVDAATDLDEYISIVNDDESKTKNYSVTSNNKSLVVDGHKVYAEISGQFSLTVTCGELNETVDVFAVNGTLDDLTTFLEPMKEETRNYKVELMLYGKYYYTYVHTDDYVVIMNEADPVNNTNAVFGTLTDGKTYIGSIAKDTKGNLTPEFQNGYVYFENYYYSYPLSLTTKNFTWSDYAGEKVWLSDDEFEENLLNYAASQNPSRNGYEYAGAIYRGIANGKAYFDCLISSSGSTGIYCSLALSSINSANLSWMDEAVKNSALVPEAIDSSEISNAITAANTGRNYTLTTKYYSCDSSGNKKLSASSRDALAYLTGAKYAEYVSTFTDKGVIAKASSIAYDKDEATQDDGYAYWSDGTNSYSSKYKKETWEAAKTLKDDDGAAIADIYSTEYLTERVVGAISKEGVSGTNWSSKKTYTAKTVFEGAVGDNTVTLVDNLLFAEAFTLTGFETGNKDIGKTFSQRTRFASHALTYASEYSDITVKSNNELSVKAIIYYPVSGLTNYYFAAEFTVTEIGTTVNDFASFSA